MGRCAVGTGGNEGWPEGSWETQGETGLFILSDAKVMGLGSPSRGAAGGWAGQEGLLETSTLEVIGSQTRGPLCIFRSLVLPGPLLS